MPSPTPSPTKSAALMTKVSRNETEQAPVVPITSRQLRTPIAQVAGEMICTRTPPCLELVQELICVSHSAPADIQQRNKVAGAKLFFDEFLQERNTSQ